MLNDIIKRELEKWRQTTKCNKHKECPITCDVGIINAYTESFLTSFAHTIAEDVKKEVKAIIDNPHTTLDQTYKELIKYLGK
jgi:hypothetical protein